jgi:hypothetical protein
MGLWSAQRNEYKSPLVKLANTTYSINGSTKRGFIERPSTLKCIGERIFSLSSIVITHLAVDDYVLVRLALM